MARSKPYVRDNLHRVPCANCGAPSCAQWSFTPCATGKRGWYAVCRRHDTAINRFIIETVRVPNGDALMAEYEAAA